MKIPPHLDPLIQALAHGSLDQFVLTFLLPPYLVAAYIIAPHTTSLRAPLPYALPHSFLRIFLTKVPKYALMIGQGSAINRGGDILVVFCQISRKWQQGSAKIDKYGRTNQLRIAWNEPEWRPCFRSYL
jgi:hypothetical protein